jgi:hypothetical protein
MDPVAEDEDGGGGDGGGGGEEEDREHHSLASTQEEGEEPGGGGYLPGNLRTEGRRREPPVRVEWEGKEPGGRRHRPSLRSPAAPASDADADADADASAASSSGMDSLGTWNTFLSGLSSKISIGGGPEADRRRAKKRGRERERRERAIETGRVGVRSVAACRRRRSSSRGPDGGGDDRTSDALEALRMLNFSMGDTPRLGDALEATAAGSGGRAGGDPVAAKGERSELLLCFLSNDGRVHLFDALRLVGSSGGAGSAGGGGGAGSPPGSDDDLSAGLASLFFGQEILSRVKATIEPLSEPEATIVLSQYGGRLVEKELDTTVDPRNGDEGDVLDPNDAPGSGNSSKDHSSSGPYDTSEGPSDPTEAECFEEAGEVAKGFINLPNFDATIEPSTIQYRTVRNRPTLCAPAFDYVAVGGDGARRFRRKGQKRAASNETFMGQSSKQEEESATTRLESRQGIPPTTRKDEGSAESDGLADVVSKQKGTVVDDWEWEYYHVPGGFVSFVSLRHYSESRTVFLPFRPKSMSPVVWDNKHFVVVLGEDPSQSSSSPRAVAIRVDSCLPADHGELSDNSHSTLNSVSGSGGYVRRFLPLEIDLSLAQTESHQGYEPASLLSVSSMLTSPPAIVSCNLMNDRKGSHGREGALLCLHSLSGFKVQAREGIPDKIVVESHVQPGHFTFLPVETMAKAKPKLWCISGQGWALAGSDGDDASSPHIMIWEGSTTSYGAYVTRLGDSNRIVNSDQLPSRTSTSHVLPTATLLLSAVPTGNESATAEVSKGSESLETPNARMVHSLPNYIRKPEDVSYTELDVKRTTSFFGDGEEHSFKPPKDSQDNEIGNICKIDSVHSTGDADQEVAPFSSKTPLSHKEKSAALLKQCSSWTQLDGNEQSKALIDGQGEKYFCRIFHVCIYFAFDAFHFRDTLELTKTSPPLQSCYLNHMLWTWCGAYLSPLDSKKYF